MCRVPHKLFSKYAKKHMGQVCLCKNLFLNNVKFITAILDYPFNTEANALHQLLLVLLMQKFTIVLCLFHFLSQDMLDLTYNPVSPFSLPKPTFPSMTSVFDKLGTTETQASDTDMDSNSENMVTAPNNELTDTFLTSKTNVSSKSNNNLIASNPHEGYYVPQGTDVASMNKLMQTGSSISPPPYPSEDSKNLSVNLVLAEDHQNNISIDGSEAQMSCIDSDYSDTRVGSQISAVELLSGDHNDTAAHASGVQSDGYIYSKNPPADKHGPLDLGNHIVEWVSLHSISLETAADPQSIPTVVESPKNEGYYVQTNEMPSLSGYLSNTIVSDGHTSAIAGDCENLLADSHGPLDTIDLCSQTVDVESLHSIPLEDTADLQSISTTAEISTNEGCYIHTKELPSSSGYLSDNSLAINCYNNSTVELSSGDHDDTAQSIHSEELLEASYGSLDFNSRAVNLESEFLSSMSQEEAADPQPIASMVESEGYYTPAQESQSSSGYLPNTKLLSSIEEEPDSIGLQTPESSSKYFGVESISMISSEHYSTTTDSTFGYFDNTIQNFSSPFKLQHPSTSSGYITDYSKAEELLYYAANEPN